MLTSIEEAQVTTFSIWSQRAKLKEASAIVVTCPDCDRIDSINSEDKVWKCPGCDKEWVVNDLARRKR